MSSPPQYHLYSYPPSKEHNVGVWPLDQQKSEELDSQPVRLGVDYGKWVADPPIGGGGPTLLSVGPYKYTTVDNKEEIIATTHGSPRKWCLIPGDLEDVFLIADSCDTDAENRSAWTAGKEGDPIKLAKLDPTQSKQAFQFVLVKE